MSTTITGNVLNGNAATTPVQAEVKTESSSQGRAVSKVSDNNRPSWLKKALLIAIVVASVFALAFTLAITAGLSGVTVLGLSGLAKTMTAALTTYGTLALAGFTFVGSITSLALAALGLSNLNPQAKKSDQAKVNEKPLNKGSLVTGEVKKEEPSPMDAAAIRKEENMWREKMTHGDFGPFKTLLAEKKPFNPIALQVFFESINIDIIHKYFNSINQNQKNELVNLFSKTSSNADERAAWAVLTLWNNQIETSNEPSASSTQSALSSEKSSEAFAILKTAASEGTALANNLLAHCFNSQLGCPKDPTLAEKHAKIAADQGLAAADLLLAEIYLNKRALENNEETRKKIGQEIMQLLHSAANKDYPLAKFALGLEYSTGSFCEKNLELSFNYLNQAAEQNHEGAILQLAMNYLNPSQGTEQDKKKALCLLEKGAALGYRQCMATLEKLNKENNN
jgi:TPR repeat protein